MKNNQEKMHKVIKKKELYDLQVTILKYRGVVMNLETKLEKVRMEMQMTICLLDVNLKDD